MTKPLKVLLISHTCQSRTEGQPKAQELGRRSDVELTVLTPDRWLHYGQWRKAEKPTGDEFNFIAGKVLWPWAGPGQFYLHWYPALKRTLLKLQPDVIDLWEEPWGLVSAQAVWLRNRYLPHTRLISETEQNIDKRLPPPFENFRSYVLGHADYVVGRNSESLRIVARKGYKGQSQVVPNAVDVELFRPLDRAACRKKLGLEGFVAGYVGRLVEEKGLVDLLEALRHLPEDVKILFVGSGPFEAELRSWLEREKLQERVVFMAAQPLENLPEIMNAIDCLVLPSRTTASWKEQFGRVLIDCLVLPSRTTASWKEQFGRVLIEAGACKTPVVGSDSGAIPDVVGEGNNALGDIFPEGNAEKLAEAILALKNDATFAQRLGETGYQRAHAEFSWAKVAEKMAGIYQQIV